MDKKNYLYGFGIVAIVAFLFLSGIIPAIFGAMIDDSPSCEDAPYDIDCACPTGWRKIEVPWLGVDKWSCEELEALLIDPESPTFESDAVDFVQEYLSMYCGSVFLDPCDGRVCGCPEDNPDCGAFESTHPIYPNDACISPVFGYGSEGARLVNVECVLVEEWRTPSGRLSHEETIAKYGNIPNDNINPGGGTAPWRMNFLVESETETPVAYEVLVSSNYCYNSETEKKCTHQSVCDYYGNPDWCVGDLPLDIISNPTQSVLSVFSKIMAVSKKTVGDISW